MASHIGIEVGTIYPQPGFSPQRDEMGGWTASQTYGMLRETWQTSTAAFRAGTPILSLDPTLEGFWEFLKVAGLSISHEEGEHVYVTANFAGSPDTQYSGIGDEDESLSDEAVPIYRLSGSLGEAPISDHPKFKELAETERIALSRIISGEYSYGDDPFGTPGENATRIIRSPTEWDPITPEPIVSEYGIEFAKLITQGQTTYVFPTITWTETTQGTSKMTAAQLNKLGRISTPRGNPPQPTGDRDWMLTGADQEESADLYQTSLQWTLSDKDGHNSFLYDT
jgi:hypothetical protein